ncbi:CD276 antigen isoform X1 [Platichthys flesus]|uniref:CD276 antigen isoform X1 n=1 Tax=Platichthys flesus TaxID=8260 RepID=UPI001A847656|nr:CD276 antigen isoform X1 [Platichthys flesus]XP_062244510.1 CD276 antigen isoform X1 [Platichthys flesus]
MLSLLLPVMLAVQATAVMEVQVPEQPVVALHGRDAVLNCSFTHASPYNLSDLSIFWQLTDTKRNVHGYTGQDQLVDQAERFANRTSLFPSQLGLGNASLLLSRVVVADEGSYTCFVRVQDYGSASLLLQVAAPYSKPVVTLEPESNLRPGDEVALTCVAYGGFPEAGVIWQDGRGRNLTDNITTSVVANEEGLFTMTSMLSVVLEPNSTYSCQLINPLLGEEGFAFVTITGQNIAFPPVALWVTVGLAVCLLVLLIALAAVCRRKIKESCEEARREAEEAKELEDEESKTGQLMSTWSSSHDATEELRPRE